MPACHSNFVDNSLRVGNMAILPLKTKCKGPAPTVSLLATKNPCLDRDANHCAVFSMSPPIKTTNEQNGKDTFRVLNATVGSTWRQYRNSF